MISLLFLNIINLLAVPELPLISLDSRPAANIVCKSNNLPFLVKDLANGPTGSDPRPLASIGNILFFTIDPFSKGEQLWKTDSTKQGTELLTNVAVEREYMNPRREAYITTNKFLFFVSRDGELWRSDGTRKGTFRLKDINPGVYSAKIQSLTKVGNTIYFTATNGSLGRELWKTDGTSAGTLLVKDIMPGVDGSSPTDLIAVGSRLYFIAEISRRSLGYNRRSDDRVDNIRTLWFSDGSEDNTKPIIIPDEPSLEGYGIENLTAIGTTLYFSSRAESYGEEIWKVDELSSQAEVVSDILPSQTIMGGSGYGHLRVLNKTLFFIDYENNLWRTNGTISTTVSLRSFDGIAAPYNEFASMAIGDTYYFVAETKQFGEELWKTDGTVGGTLLVKDINPGSYGSSPKELTKVSNILYFTAENGTFGRELWRTDGTEEGTKLVKDIYPGGDSYVDYWPKYLTPVGNFLYFTARYKNVKRQLWKTDGTPKGTVLVSPLPGGLPGFDPWFLMPAGSKLYFSARGDDRTGRELWAVSTACAK